MYRFPPLTKLKVKDLAEISRTTPTRVIEPRIAVAMMLNKVPLITVQKYR
jgi:hypothetical protein